MSHIVTHMRYKMRSRPSSATDRKTGELVNEYAPPSDAGNTQKQRVNSRDRPQGVVVVRRQMSTVVAVSETSDTLSRSTTPERQVTSSHDIVTNADEMQRDTAMASNLRPSSTIRYGHQQHGTLPNCCSVTPVAVVSPVTLSSMASDDVSPSAPFSSAMMPAQPTEQLSSPSSPSVIEQCHVMPQGYVIVTSHESPAMLQIFECHNSSSADRKTCPLAAELTCDSPVHCFLCLDNGHAALVQINSVTSLVLAATEAGRLFSWQLELPPREQTRNDDVASFRTHCTNQFALHLPNPIRAIAASTDGCHLATGCCFSKYDILAGGNVSRSIRGVVKTWDLSIIVECSFNSKSSRNQVSFWSSFYCACGCVHYI